MVGMDGPLDDEAELGALLKRVERLEKILHALLMGERRVLIMRLGQVEDDGLKIERTIPPKRERDKEF